MSGAASEQSVDVWSEDALSINIRVPIIPFIISGTVLPYKAIVETSAPLVVRMMQTNCAAKDPPTTHHNHLEIRLQLPGIFRKHHNQAVLRSHLFSSLHKGRPPCSVNMGAFLLSSWYVLQ